MVDRLAGGSLTRRSKGPFAVLWLRQLGEQFKIKITRGAQILVFIFLMEPNGSLCVSTCPNGSSWVLIGPYALLCDLMGPCRSLCVFLGPYGLL